MLAYFLLLIHLGGGTLERKKGRYSDNNNKRLITHPGFDAGVFFIAMVPVGPRSKPAPVHLAISQKYTCSESSPRCYQRGMDCH
jgi:hypothetical protein